ncbi:MAG: hypothetical protein F6K24_05230 [Okeania sp. SIO2D1]|nr:hypothetical protein [Okeania sp. SIO2D1]
MLPFESLTPIDRYNFLLKHENYVGKRVKLGLFRSATGKVINADINGSLQILR